MNKQKIVIPSEIGLAAVLCESDSCPDWLNCGLVCRKDGEYESDLVYASIADCATGNWFWITWEPTGLVTLGQGHSPNKVMTLNSSVHDL